MAWPAIIGGAIAAGGSILGGVLGDKATSKANKRNIEFQKEFAQHGLSWKAEDAKRAGLHPLYAMGAPTSSPTAAIMPKSGKAEGIAQAGQHIGRAVQARQTQAQRQLTQLQLERLSAETKKEYAIASYYESEASRNTQSRNVSKAIGGSAQAFPLRDDGRTIRVQELADYYDTVEANPDRMVSKRKQDPSLGAGTHSAWREYEASPGVKGVLLYSEEGPSEAVQDAGPQMVWATYQKNKRIYGRKQARRFVNHFFPGYMKVIDIWEGAKEYMRPRRYRYPQSR